jgi:dihydroorotase
MLYAGVASALEEAVEKGWIQDEDITYETLVEFLGGRGRRFYNIQSLVKENNEKRIVLEKKGERIPEGIKSKDGSIEVVPFRRGEEIWSLRWKINM